jgi:hypothetical protein
VFSLYSIYGVLLAIQWTKNWNPKFILLFSHTYYSFITDNAITH